MSSKLRECDSFAMLLTELIDVQGFENNGHVSTAAWEMGLIKAEKVDSLTRSIYNWRKGVAPHPTRSKVHLEMVRKILNPNEDETINKLWEELLKKSRENVSDNIVDATTVPVAPADSSIATENSNSTETTDLQQVIKHINNTNQVSTSSRLAVVSIAVSVIAVTSFYLIDRSAAPSLFLERIPPTEVNLSIDGFVVPDSQNEVISEETLKSLTAWELFIARNEIFARHGREFVRPHAQCVQRHFDQFAQSKNNPDGWYKKIEDFEPSLNSIEDLNVRKILKHECNVRGGQIRCDAKLNVC